tara:strand:+ start:191 stop:1030 length:840 start_codon:yes stop_codon:yes gene_type:complete
MKRINLNLYPEHCSVDSHCRHFGLFFTANNYIFTDEFNPNFYNEKYNEFCNRSKPLGHFIRFNSNETPRYASAVVDFSKYNLYQKYHDNLPSNVVRDCKISEKNRYIFEEFRYENFIPDIHHIHQSTLKRKSKVNPYYLRSIEEMGGAPKIEMEVNNPKCELHNTRWYGVFRYLKNYKQGNITTNKKLIAYSGVARDGDFSCITFIFGLNEYLKNGIMFYLITNIVKRLIEDKKPPKCLQYWSMDNSEGKGLTSWKKRMLFEPAYLYAGQINRGFSLNG